jgi:methionyl-tRNA formyltransferase
MSDPAIADSLRVVVFTDLPAVAAAYPQLLSAYGHQVVGVVTSRKRNFGLGDVVNAAPATADLIVSDHPRRWAAMLAPLRPDLIISTSFPWRIPQGVLDLPRLGAINLHPSLLPKYRGTMTPVWTLLNGERTSGVTAHRMLADFDTGPILAQAAVEVGDDDNLGDYMQSIFAVAPAVFETALRRVIAGDPGEPQDESQATYFGQLPDEIRTIDWASPARRIHNQVRALSGFTIESGAYGIVDDVPSRILRTRLLFNDSTITDREPGTVISRDDEGLTIQCGDGPIRVLEFVPDVPA